MYRLQSTLILLLAILTLVTSDCDMNGLCLRLQSIIRQNTLLCNADEMCIHPKQPDCNLDQTTPNEFTCDATDCIVIQVSATSIQGCYEHFPNIKNTAMEEHGEHELADEFPSASFDQTEPSKDKPTLIDGVLQFHSALRPKK